MTEGAASSRSVPRPDPGRRRFTFVSLCRSGVVALLLVLAYFRLPLTRVSAVGELVTLVGGLAVVAVVLVWHVRMVLVSPYPAVRAATALTVTVPLFLVVFATIYVLLASSDASQFSERLTRMDALYYTVTVFATVGFGDITAVSQAARAVTTLQMVAGLALVGVIARFVMGAVQVNWRRRGLD